MRKGTIAVLMIIVLLMSVGCKSTYDKVVPEQADIKENIDLVMNKPNIEENGTYQYENTKKPVLEITYKIDIDPELREVILNYHKTDLRLGKPFEEPQIISYWKMDDNQYRIKTAGYYSFGFGIWEPIDYTFFVERNSNGDLIIKRWSGGVFNSEASRGMRLQNFFDMEESFKKDANYSDICELLPKFASKYYTGLGHLHIIHYRKLNDTQYEVGFIDEFDYGVSHPMWESRIFLLQKNDNNQWNDVYLNTFIPDDWSKIISERNAASYIAKKVYEQGNYMSGFKVESFNKVSDNEISLTVSYDENIENTSNNSVSKSRKIAQVYLKEDSDGKWTVSSMKELD